MNKVNYYNNCFDSKLQNSEIFPFLFLFNLRKDIVPRYLRHNQRFEIIKKYNRMFDLKTAFELTPEKFVDLIGADMDVNYELITGMDRIFER